MAEVTGNDIFEAARDLLVARVTDLISDQSGAGDDPAIGYVYERHDVAKLLLNGCTVALERARTNEERTVGNRGLGWMWEMLFTVRVHTAYLPHGIRDDQKVARLLNSLLNQFQTKIKLDTTFRIDAITDLMVGEDFEESATYGGQLTVQVSLWVRQVQE